MEHKDCKIVCDGTEIGTITCTKEGINIKFTKDCMEKIHSCCDDGCCK